MNAQQFAQFFRPSVRVLLDWDAVEESDWPIDVGIAASVRDLMGWYFPWHVGDSGDETRFDDPAARPLRIVEWPLPTFTAHRQAVSEMAAALRAFPGPAQFVVAAYALPEESRLVLDGNHRLAAVVQERLPFCALVMTVHAPVAEEILPDLRHWVN